jgi:hypothetical protein
VDSHQEHDVHPERPPDDDAVGEERQAHRHRDGGQDVHHARDLALERRRRPANLDAQRGDRPKLGVSPRRIDDGRAGAPDDRAAREGEVRAVDHAPAIDALDAQAHVARLPRERGVVREQIVALDDPRVRGDPIPFDEAHDVTGNELLDGYGALYAAAARGDAPREKLAEDLHRALCTHGLREREEPVQRGDGEQGPAEHAHALPPLHAIAHEAERGRDHQQDAEHVRELPRERA